MLVEHTLSHAMTMMGLLSPVAPPSFNNNNDDKTSRHEYNRIPFLPLMRHRKPLKESLTLLQQNPRTTLFQSWVMHVMVRLLSWTTVVGTVAAVVWYSYDLKTTGELEYTTYYSTGSV